MSSIVFFCTNFSLDYINYLIVRIPSNFKLVLEKKEYFNKYKFDSKTIGYIYGSRFDEENEVVKFSFVHKNEVNVLDIDELFNFLCSI